MNGFMKQSDSDKYKSIYNYFRGHVMKHPHYSIALISI